MSNRNQDALQLFIRHLTTAATTAALYHLEHLQVQRLCRKALEQVKTLHTGQNSIILKIIEGQLIFANKPVPTNMASERLRDALLSHNITYLQIEAGVYSEELLGLVSVLGKRTDKKIALSDTEHIHFGQIEVRLRQQPSESRSVQSELAEIAASEQDRLMELYDSVRQKQQLKVNGISEIVGGFISAFGSHSDAFLAIAPLRSMDEYTYTHSTNICLLNLAQARQLGIEGPLLNEIGIAAMLHDVGKMFIDPLILSKSDKLTEADWQIVQQHPRLGAEYLLGSPGVPRLAVVTAFEHHMRYDGTGYPQTSRRWPQNLSSYMTAISDTYDAMRTHRAYEKSLAPEQISETMLGLAGSKLHPTLTRSFLATLQQLETGR
ncbi:MAG TPA: HD domain-containing phosphohydrolase [Malonomonas sp.]